MLEGCYLHCIALFSQLSHCREAPQGQKFKRNKIMKLNSLTCSASMALFAALAVPTGMTAQDQSSAHAPTVEHSRFEAVDIPTFGGPASYINPASVYGSQTQINARGTAVGGAATSIPSVPTSNGFVCFGPAGAVPFVYHAFESLNGNTTDLGTLGSAAECSLATSINAKGQIVGNSELEEIDPVLGLKQVRAVLWENSKVINLGTFGGSYSGAAANNSRGQVIGFATNQIPDPFSFFYQVLAGASTGTQTRAFLWQNGELLDLGTLGGPDAAAFAVNQLGQVVGGSYVNSTPNLATGIPTIDCFLWENGKMTDLGSLGGTDCVVTAINNRGQVIGAANLAGDGIADPFLWGDEKLIDLYTSTGGKVLAVDSINDAGEIVGAADFSRMGASPISAVLWKNGVSINLGTLSGDCYSHAHVINSKGQVVGESFACDTFEARAFLWENGSMIDLNANIPAGFSLRLTNAATINERGEIGGYGAPVGCEDSELCGRAFLLIPTGWNDTNAISPVTRNPPPTYKLPSSLATGNPLLTARMERLRARMSRRPVSNAMWRTR
jgi:probable HAF family extracellular repeat protein